MIKPTSSNPLITQSSNRAQAQNSASLYAQSASAAPQAQSERVTLSAAGSRQAQLHDLAQRYDVTSMSDRQMGQFAGELKDRGLISEREFFDMSIVIKPPGGNYDPDAPKNFLSQYQAQTEASKIYSTPEDTRMLEHLSSLLLSIQQSRTGALT